MTIVERLEPYEHVIWDWNGTLIDDLELSVALTNEFLAEAGLPQICKDRHRERFRLPVRAYYEELGLNEWNSDYLALSHRFVERYEKRFASSVGLFDGVREDLVAIGKEKVQSILSAAEEQHLHFMVKHFDILHFFEHVYGLGDKGADSKIQRGRDLMAATAIPRELTVLVGDTDHDCEVAEALGIDVLLVADGHQSLRRLESVHHNVLASRKFRTSHSE